MTNISRESKVNGGVWILEQFAQHHGVHERNEPRRVLNEVLRAWPGDVHRLWWKWFTEAASSMGMRAKALDCTLEESLQLIADGAEMVCYSDEPEPTWFLIRLGKRQKFEVSRVSEQARTSRMGRRGVLKLLQQIAAGGNLRCVVFQAQPGHLGSNHQEHSLTPLQRLRSLLRPEWSDIWIVIVFAFFVGLLALASPIAVEALVNTVAFGRFLQPIVILAIILLTFLGFQAAARGLQTYVVEIIQRRLFARMAADLADRLPKAEVEATDGQYAPELVNRFFDIVTVQKVSAQLLLDGIGIVLSTVIGMAVLGFYHPFLLGFDMLLLASIAFIIFVLGRGAVSSAIKESKNKYSMAAWLEDIARCPVAFRNEGGAEFALERADRLIHNYLSARRKHFRILIRQILFALGLQAVASTLLLGLGGWLVVSGELTLGQLVAAELIVTTIVGAFAKFGKHMESFYDLLAAVDKLGVLIDLPMQREDGMLSVDEEGPVRLELNAVGYRWPEEPNVFSGVSAAVSPGASLAVVGASGTGKSTLLDLIYGLRVPTSGHLSLDGFDPRDLRPDVLRRHVSMARGVEAFHGTVEENVHLHRDDLTATDVRDALGAVGLLNSVLHLDEGCSTMLTSSGAPLTENQCRLLTIARAIAPQPGLLLIDGVLDPLPDDEQQLVLDFLLQPQQPWTVVIATGREAIAQRCTARIDLNQRSISTNK